MHAFQGSDLLQVDDKGNVEINLTANVVALRPALEAAGFHVLYSVPDRHVIEGYMPIKRAAESGAARGAGIDGRGCDISSANRRGACDQPGRLGTSVGPIPHQTGYTGSGVHMRRLER